MDTRWQEISDILQNSINPGLFAVWIKPLSAEVSDKELTLIAPNEFVAVWVRDRLKNEIAEAAQAVLGIVPSITVLADRSRVVKDGSVCPKPSPIMGRPVRARQVRLPIEMPAVAPGASYKWKFSFDDFVVGPSNELAYAAAKGLCDTTMGADQLFLSSTSGLGKTHLLQALGQALSTVCNKKHPRIEYLSGEEFARRWLGALQAKQLESFKNRYRDSVDILLLEDIHFFQGKQKMQDELLSTIRALQDRGSKVVFSSSFLPRELKDVDSQLASRFCSGFLAVINKPDYETRRRIILKKSEIFECPLSDNVASLLADRLVSDVRQLESCLQNLILKAKLLNQSITPELAEKVLENYAPQEAKLNMDAIVDFICKSYDLSETDLNSRSRQRRIVQARNAAFFLARKHTDLSLKDIGDRFSRRHSTVFKAISNVEREIQLETPLGRQLKHTVDIAGRFGAQIPASPE
ncbi:MAG: chromosomal replication initiator protein DnaA [Oceanidesulfovibrio sp.]